MGAGGGGVGEGGVGEGTLRLPSSWVDRMGQPLRGLRGEAFLEDAVAGRFLMVGWGSVGRMVSAVLCLFIGMVISLAVVLLSLVVIGKSLIGREDGFC